ncbi:HU family DNA-binding protein (plasmid) [Niallia taxi]|uniref:HU family DNA-binding protein n=1 Tax=Niallia taxi TaxID=2499688 RepID=UPI00399CE056
MHYELINTIAESSELTKKESTKVVDSEMETIKTGMKNGEKVKILGFSAFSVSERVSRKGRNPQTSEEIEIAASKAPFKAGKNLKDAIKV